MHQTFTEAGSQHLNVVSLSQEHRDTQPDKETETIIYGSQQSGTRVRFLTSVQMGVKLTAKYNRQILIFLNDVFNLKCLSL